ncbi:hypothetical protein ACGFSG_26805 [Streptomyces sp. NPDC048512]|uniref:hypothetical protein n=1 Tax=Streptomyces sp. NPDC048512 TaxID=3365563 RepID=UPI00371194EB
MRWPWQHSLRTTACSRPRLLPTATDGISFEAVYTIIWRPRRRSHPSAEDAVRTHVHTTALNAAAHLPATDLPAAQDAVNAALPHRCHSPHHWLLSARAALHLPATAQDFLHQQQADDHRIRRLRFLKERLYDHPGLVVLDRLEHHSPGALDDDHVAELQRLARLITSCDRWWSPLMQQWEQLGHGFSDTEKQQQAMLALLDSLKTLNGGSLPAGPTGPEPDAFTAEQRKAAHP